MSCRAKAKCVEWNNERIVSARVGKICLAHIAYFYRARKYFAEKKERSESAGRWNIKFLSFPFFLCETSGKQKKNNDLMSFQRENEK
jgi:hypothetical protein